MFRHLVFVSVLLAASALSLHAQTTSTIVLTGVGCPVAFSASRDGALLARARTPAPGVVNPAESTSLVNVHFAKASVARILDVQGSVYGTTAAPHMQLLSGEVGDVLDTKGPQVRTQAFHLTGFDSEASTLDWKLAISGVPLIQGVRLSEVHLSDGTVWHESAHSHCRAQISGFLPVSTVLR